MIPPSMKHRLEKIQPTSTREAVRPAGRPEVALDLRDDLRNGREPFKRIMAAVSALATDEVLLLRTIFDPVPLYAVLGKRGFNHDAVAHAPDDWSIWLWREAAPPDRSARVATDDSRMSADTAISADETWLDVRGLEPPEPMVLTLQALDALPAGHTLVQVNLRTPRFLLPILAERGFDYQVEAGQPDRVLVRIRRAT